MSGSLVVMGVAGCGKSTVVVCAAYALGLPLVEGDALHNPDTLARMRAGQPLTHDDCDGWHQLLADQLRRGPQALSCSALKRAYRERLRAASPGLRFVFLEISPALALARVEARGGYVLSADLIASQFAMLEPPTGEAGVLRLPATAPLEEIEQQIAVWWRA